MLAIKHSIAFLLLLLILGRLPDSIARGQNGESGDDFTARRIEPPEPGVSSARRRQAESADRQEPDAILSETASTPDSIARIPAGLDEYMGRRIAQTMHYAGAEWLIRDRREREERCSLMLANLGVRPGMTVCDMGCGNGFHSLAMAKMVGENGLVIGVDVQPEMLGFLRQRMEDQGVENVIPILGSYHNPRLPPDTIDLALMVDVYHEFSHPEQMLTSIRNSLKADGLVVLVEYREEDESVPIKPLHKMSKAQVNRELEANGFKLVKEFDKLPWQHMMFFGKSTDAQNPSERATGPTSQDKQAGGADKKPPQ